MTQKHSIRKHLLRGDAITPLDALRAYGVFRLAARIKELRDDGLNISTVRIDDRGKRFARYHLRLSK